MENSPVRRKIALGLAACVSIAASLNAQSVAVGVKSESARPATVSVDVTNAPLAHVLAVIARQAGLRTSWDESVVKAAPLVSLRVRNVSVDVAFERALVGTGLRAEITQRMVALVGDGAARVLNGGITGTVVDAKTKLPLRGVTLVLDGSTKGAISGNEGSFKFDNVAPGVHTIKVRFMGYVKATKTVDVQDGQAASITIALEQSTNELDQVVVTGTIAPTELRAVPNAITVITAKDIEQKGITQIQQLFTGDVPGLFAMNRGASARFDEVTMFSRGATSFSGSGYSQIGTDLSTNPIKTFIDGIEMSDPKYMSQIDPKMIERIEIVSGPQAATVYGSNAINGVMQIFTKRGATRKPKLDVSYSTGFTQNNLGSIQGQDHRGDINISGMEGRLSYTLGTVLSYSPPWTSNIENQNVAANGSGDFTTGKVRSTVSGRMTLGRKKQNRGGTELGYDEGGNAISRRGLVGSGGLYRQSLVSQTLGFSTSYAPLSWWSNQAKIGVDRSYLEGIGSGRAFADPSDSLGVIRNAGSYRITQGYGSTLQANKSEKVQMVLSFGVDQSKRFSSSSEVYSVVDTGQIKGATIRRDVPTNDVGGYLQSRLTVYGLSLTYGARAQWNPGFGKDAQPNIVPTYGATYNIDLGELNVKSRASLGPATRPPRVGLRDSVAANLSCCEAYRKAFGPINTVLANPELGPEIQKGAEGGVDIYWANLLSLSVTRYNQTVNNLIGYVGNVDSARSFFPASEGGCDGVDGSYSRPDGYCYVLQGQYLNLGSIRNQGWELTGRINVRSFTISGTYSWTKSRVIGITEKYRALLSGSSFRKGAPFNYLPEHTWSLNASYTNRRLSGNFRLNGIGKLFGEGSQTRLLAGSSPDGRFVWPYGIRARGNNNGLSLMAYPAYVMTDLNTSCRISSKLSGTASIQNLMNFYRNDYSAGSSVPGRSAQFGLNISL